MSLPRATYTAILLGTLAWCTALFLAPIFDASSTLHAGGGLLYALFHPICHQLDDRSFHILGRPLAVCARCSSIYLAFLVGALLYPLLSKRVAPPRRLLMVSLLPMLLDVVTGALGIHEVTNVTRAITGAFFGVFIPFIVIPVAMEAVPQLLSSPAHIVNTTNHHVQKGPSHA